MASIFSQEWRDCLRAHYTYVVRMGDVGTEKTLRFVMYDAGFGEDEVKQLYVLATAHVDDVGVDFVPDMEIFEEAEPATVMVAVAVPVGTPEEIVEAIAVEEETVALEEDAELELETVEAELEATHDDEPPQDDPGATQLSLF